jgi:adenosylcobinamide-GDP ribazoletransferase
MFDRFLSTLSLVSRFPVKARFKFDASRMDFYLPITGLFPAVLGFAVYFAALWLSGLKLFAVAAGIFVQYLGFNLFHLDGLADTADAFLGSQSRERRFAILKDSRVGVYGLFAGISAPAFKLLLLYGILGGGNGLTTYTDLLVFIYPVSGRFGAALIPCITPPAKPEGLGALASGSRVRRVLAGTLAALLAGWALIFAAASASAETADIWKAFIIIPYFALPLLAGLVSAVFYAHVYRKALGGYSGDALGAAIETGETIFLLLAAVAFNILGGAEAWAAHSFSSWYNPV